MWSRVSRPPPEQTEEGFPEIGSKERIEKALKEAPEGESRHQTITRAKGDIIVEMWRDYPAKNADGHAVFTFGKSTVAITRLEVHDEEEGTAVLIWTGAKKGAADFRIINPPFLVEDPHGDVEVKAGDKTLRYREDPIHSMAQTICEVRRGTR